MTLVNGTESPPPPQPQPDLNGNTPGRPNGLSNGQSSPVLDAINPLVEELSSPQRPSNGAKPFPIRGLDQA